jgi:hypothetical protein
MNLNGLAKKYDQLTPLERFKLVLASSDRGDEAERDRLVASAKRDTFRMPDHAPFAQAFIEMAWAVYAELLDAAADTLERFAMTYSDIVDNVNDDELTDDGDEDDDEIDDGADPAIDPDAWDGEPEYVRLLNLAYASGYILNAKVAGWHLFCERLHVPPYGTFRSAPGFPRFERAHTLAQVAAFKPDGMVRWMNKVRKSGEARTSLTDIVTSERYAEYCENCFAERVRWWGGPSIRFQKDSEHG